MAGFYLYGAVQLRVNLPQEVFNLLHDDIDSFMNMPEKHELSRIINRIITVYDRIDNSTKFTSTRKERGTRKKQSTDESIRISLQERTINVIENIDSSISELFEGQHKDFIIDVLCAYAQLPYYKREKIYFHEIYDKIHGCISQGRIIRLSMSDRTGIVNFKPYKISTERNATFNYLIGKSYIPETNSWNLSAYRLQRIVNVQNTAESFVFTDEELSEICTEIMQLDIIPYLSAPKVEAEVRLTDKGLRLYKTVILFQRPRYTAILNSGENNHRLYFRCSENQLFNYFIKFGEDAEIITPPTLRKRFRDTAEALYKSYLVE